MLFLVLNNKYLIVKKKKKKSPLLPCFCTLPGISFTTPVCQNMTTSILISKIHAKGTPTMTLICRDVISLDPRLSSPNGLAK